MRFVAAVALMMACVACAAGQQPPTMRVNVRLVDVTFSVRGVDGALAANLGRDDFDVFEDGVPQKIAVFAHTSEVPLTLGLIADFSGSQEHSLKDHHRDVERFLGTVLGPRDRAFVVGFGDHLRLLHDFSVSGQDLMDALDNYGRHRGHYPELGPADEERDGGTAFYDALYYAVTEKLADSPGGQKALLVFSDGEDNSSAHHMLDVIEAAERSNVRIYGVRYTESHRGRMTARNKYGTSVMARIAGATGAATFDARAGGVAAWFEEIADELRSSYELAYYPSVPAEDDPAFRKIAIRAHRAGLVVRAKSGYLPAPAR